MTPGRRLTILTVILAGYVLIFAAAFGLGSFANRGMDQLRGIARDLHDHPFAVSNAASDMKGVLFQLRNHVLQVVLLRHSYDNQDRLRREADRLDQAATANLEVIQDYFLGDMSQVRLLEDKLDQWRSIRQEIFAAVRNGNYETAEYLVREVGTPKFLEIVPLVDYVHGFAKNKAREFAEQAETQSEAVSSQTRRLFAALLAGIALTGGVVVWRVRSLQAQLDRQATTDFLTGIANRRHFMALVEQEYLRSRRYRSSFALAVVDLDHFKQINDRHGHPAGDLALKTFSTVCKQHLRDSDIVGRIGGEEFAILLPNADLQEARQITERVRQAVESTEMRTDKAMDFSITASFGLAVYHSSDADISLLFRRADESLYQAKEEGRNRVCVREHQGAAQPETVPA